MRIFFSLDLLSDSSVFVTNESLEIQNSSFADSLFHGKSAVNNRQGLFAVAKFLKLAVECIDSELVCEVARPKS